MTAGRHQSDRQAQVVAAQPCLDGFLHVRRAEDVTDLELDRIDVGDGRAGGRDLPRVGAVALGRRVGADDETVADQAMVGGAAGDVDEQRPILHVIRDRPAEPDQRRLPCQVLDGDQSAVRFAPAYVLTVGQNWINDVDQSRRNLIASGKEFECRMRWTIRNIRPNDQHGL